MNIQALYSVISSYLIAYKLTQKSGYLEIVAFTSDYLFFLFQHCKHITQFFISVWVKFLYVPSLSIAFLLFLSIYLSLLSFSHHWIKNQVKCLRAVSDNVEIE